MIGNKIHNLAKELWPINRSIAGNGNRKTLKILKKINKKLKIIEFKSNKKVFDWTIPKEWDVKEAWIKDMNNKKIIDFKNNNLHLVNYSQPINKKITLKDLRNKIYTLKDKPKAIPYVTSYYEKNWGFCVDYNSFKKIQDSHYLVKIDSKFKSGNMSIGEILIKGKSKKEILITTYICHPSLANNEISGPCLSIFLSNWILKKKRQYTYRFIFAPETIGAISYINKNITKLKKNVIAGLVITCVGDERNFSFLPSKNGDGILDKIIRNVLITKNIKYKEFNWLKRGSDERQYCWPNTDISMSSIMRSKYHEYPEYHTSLDDLKNVVTPKGFEGSFKLYKNIITSLEREKFPTSTTFCEPMLSKYDLYPTVNFNNNKNKMKIYSKKILNILSYSDGKHSIKEISNKCKIKIENCKKMIVKLEKLKLLVCY